MYILKEDLMKKRVLSLFMVLVLCLTLLPTAAFAEGEDVSISGGVIGGGETGGEGGGIYVAPGSPTEGGGGTYIPGEDTRTEIWCTMKPSLIQRNYDGTTDGGTIPIDLTFTDGTNEIKLKEGTGFTAKKTFDFADAGRHTVTVEIELIGDAAAKYRLKAGEETFTIGGYIDKAYPDLTVSLSKAACTAGEKLLPLLSVEGAPEDAEVTYYYLASALKSWAGSSDVEGSEAMPEIDENTAISEPGTYYVYAKTGETTNYKEERSTTVELTVNEAVVEAASITKADGMDGGTYESLPAALNAAQDGDTVKLLADHTTNWSDVEAGEYATLAVVRKTLTLDLNGMTVDYLTVGDVVPDEEGGILESYDGNLTVVENVQGGSYGKIKNLEFVKGSLAIQGGRIGDFDGSKLTCKENSGTVTISGGMVCNATVGDGATVTVSGGTMHQGEWVNNGTLNIKGGTFGAVNFHNNSGTIAISGGTFSTLKNYDNTSSFPIAPISLLAPGHAFYKDNTVQDGSRRDFLQDVTVKEHTHTMVNNKCACGVAAIVVDNNNSFYNTLQAALNAAADNASITSVTLGQDLTEDVTFNRSAAESLTLNMNGHKLETEAGVPLTVTGGTLRIEGAGEINQNTASNATAFPAISLTGGKLVITGDLTAQGGYDSSSGRKPAIYATDGELDLQGNVSLNGGLTITGTAKLTNPLTQGTFYVDASETGNAIAITDSEVPGGEVYKKALELLAKDYAFYRANGSLADAGGAKLRTGTYTIKSHTCSYTHDETYGIAYCKCGRSHAHRDLSEEKSVLVNGVCPICGYHCPHNTVDETTLSCSDCGAKVVAKVEVEGSEPTYAFDLASAFQNAVNGTTIKLLANEMLPSDTYVSKTLTLDLNGHSLSGYSLNVGGLTAMSQVRTGKLTVIDSSGGNGAVGVTVRDGGTLVFDPKNDHTTLLQLEVWGGTVELCGGKISRSGLRLHNGITLGDLLPQKAGLAYYRGGTQLTLEEATSQTCDLVVKSCSHGGKNGFDKSATTCPYCGAPAVAETALNNGEGNRPWRRFADLQTALDADRDGGATLKLLADVTGDYTINGTQDTGLDLNGHSIKGTVTVKGIKGDFITTTLSNTQNTTTASIDKVVAYKGAKLAGSGFPAVIGTLTLAEGATWKNILNLKTLGYKVLNADGTYKWYAPNDVKGSQLNNVIINSLPITTKTLNLKVDGKNLTGNSPKVERGTTVQLCASCNKDAEVTFSILKTGETTPITLTEPSYSGGKYTKDYSFDTIGEYTIYFTATKDGYSVTSSHKKLTVTKPNLSNAEITFPYGNEAAFNSVSATGVPMFVVTYNGTKLEENVDFVITSGDSTYDVGPCTLTIKATDNGDYTGSKSAQWNVRPLKVAASVGDIIKTYDGTTDLPANAKITFKSADSYYTGTTLRLAKGTDYEVSNAHYDSADASETEKTVSFTIKLKNAGYVFEDGTTQKDFTLNGADFDDKTFQINKATVPMNNPIGTLNIINGTCQTYTYDFNNILPGLPGGKYGTISYGQADISLVSQSGYYYDETIVEFKKGVLTLAQFYAKDGKMTGRIGDVKVNVTTTNYENFQLKLVLYAVDQIKPEPDGTITATPITYGDALSKSTISGKMKDPNTGDAVNGTFAWTNGTIKPDANDRYEAEWTFTPAAGYEKYATATGTVTIKVAPKSIEGATITLKKREFTYNAAEQSPTITGVMLKGWSETITTYDIVSGDKAINANDSITLTIKGTGNYTGTATAEWKIIPAKLTVSVPSEVKKEYDGTTNATVTPTFNGLRGKDNLTAADYSVTAAFDNAKVGYKKTVIGKVTLNQTETAKNYVLTNDGNFSTDDGTITKAVAPTVQPVELTIYNGVQADYYVDLPSLPDMGKGKSYGTVGYRKTHTINLSEGYKAQSDLRADPENLNTLRLLLHMTQTGSLTGEIGTVTIPVTTSNYQDITLTVKISAKNRITPTGTPTLSKNAIIYGDALNTIALSGKLHDNVNNVDVDGTFEWVDGTHIPAVGNGTYAAEWIFEPTDTEKYLTVSGRSNITVEKARQYGKLSMAGYTYGKTPSTPTLTDQTGDLNAQVTYSYAAADSGSVQTWDISNPPALNAGTYRMYASIGDTDNYYGFEAVYCEFVVAKATPTYTVSTGLTAKYGQTLADVTLPDGWSWMDSSESVGGASTAAKTFQAKFTPKDTENYNTVENIELEVTVNKADGGNLKTVELEQKYTDASDHTYTPDWAGLPAGQDWTFSSEASIVLPKQDFAADGNLLTYAISGGKAGDKITLILKASCDNYEDFTITLNVTLTEKDDQKPLTITGNTSVIYGEKLTLTTTGGSGMGAVTYRIDNAISTGEATIDPNTGVLTPVKVGSVSVIATKAGDNNYNDVTSAPFVLMIKPATPTGEPKYTKITTSGKTLKDVTLTIEGSALNPSDGKLEWVDDKGEPLPDDTTVKANTTYKWRFTPDDDNYTTLTGEVELYHKSSSGGGWYDSYYTIKATAGAGGSISPSGNVSVREGGDQTFTITPDKGYAVANVKIDGKSIGAVKSYTFENVSSPHTIEAIFVKGTASASTGDSSNLPLWSALLLASTLALAGAVHLKRKRAR